MRKLLNNPWAVTVLALAALSFVVLSLRDQMGGSGRASSVSADAIETPSDEEAETQGTGPGVLSIPATLAALSFPATLPDPFRRRGSTMVAGDVVVEAGPALPDDVETVRLTAVWNQGASAYAVLNGRIMRPGEIVGRMTIDTIATDGVWVSHWKGRNFVSFGGEFTLVTPAAPPSPRSPSLHEN